MLMNVLLLMLILAVVYKIQYAGKGNFFDDGMSIQNTTCLRGIACIIVVYAHYIKTMDDCRWPFFIFREIAFLAVAVFFFLSGYGLVYGLRNKNNYLDKFLSKRMTKLLIPYLVANVVYITYKSILGDITSVTEVAKSFVDGSPVVDNSWYVIAIVLFYVLFYAVAKALSKLNRNSNHIYIYI